MIPNQWYVILESKEVKPGKPIGLTRFGEKLVAWRDSHGRLSVMRDRCPHRGVALSVGDIRGDCLECPFHGFQFDTTGTLHVDPGQWPHRRAAQSHARQSRFPRRKRTASSTCGTANRRSNIRRCPSST